jgi:putative transposase
MARKFGKSVSEAGLKQLINMLAYKCRIGGRELIPVASFQTTMICSACGSVEGPRGLSGLAVRQWDCACGAHHDRDINAAKNFLYAGLGTSLERRRYVA